MTSEVNADLRIELSNLNYPGIHVHVARWLESDQKAILALRLKP